MLKVFARNQETLRHALIGVSCCIHIQFDATELVEKEKMSNSTTFFSGLVCAAMMCGCGGPSDPDRPDTTPVSGVVSYQGAPLEGATVTFKPSTTDGKAAFGKSDADGKFSLTTFEADDGVIPGEYNVTVTKMEVVESKAVPEDDPNYDPNYLEPEPKSLIPEKYGDSAKSGLTASVGSESIQDLKLELAD